MISLLQKYKEYKYKKKIAKSPKSLEEALVWLKSNLNENQLHDIKTQPPIGLHFGLGMHLRNEWGLWHDSPLAQYFNSIGIHHADDMSGIVLESLYRELNNTPINLDEQVKIYQDYWKKIKD